MLVKFLSFIASVLSNARYKAVLVPSIVVVLAVTGLTTIALVHAGNSHTAASTAGKTTDTGLAQPTKTTQVGGQQNPKDETTPDSATAPPQTNMPDGQTNPSHAEAAAPAAPDIVLAPSTFSVAQGASTSTTALATTSDNSTVSWAITPEFESSTVQALLAGEKPKDASDSISFRFQASGDATPGRYRFTLRARDVTRKIDVAREVIVTVTNYTPARPF